MAQLTYDTDIRQDIGVRICVYIARELSESSEPYHIHQAEVLWRLAMRDERARSKRVRVLTQEQKDIKNMQRRLKYTKK